MSTINKKHIALRLRAACGYTDRESLRTVKDVITVLRDLLEDLGTDESLVLEHIGRFVSRPKAHMSGTSLHRLQFEPSGAMAAMFRARPLPDDHPRVIAAKEKKAMLDALPQKPWWRTSRPDANV